MDCFHATMSDDHRTESSNVKANHDLKETVDSCQPAISDDHSTESLNVEANQDLKEKNLKEIVSKYGNVRFGDLTTEDEAEDAPDDEAEESAFAMEVKDRLEKREPTGLQQGDQSCDLDNTDVATNSTPLDLKEFQEEQNPFIDMVDSLPMSQFATKDELQLLRQIHEAWRLRRECKIRNIPPDPTLGMITDRAPVPGKNQWRNKKKEIRRELGLAVEPRIRGIMKKLRYQKEREQVLAEKGEESGTELFLPDDTELFVPDSTCDELRHMFPPMRPSGKPTREEFRPMYPSARPTCEQFGHMFPPMYPSARPTYRPSYEEHGYMFPSAR